MTDELDKTMPGYRDRKTDGRFAIGDLIMGRYKVLAELGKGGMGIVYKCEDQTSHVCYAVKTLAPELTDSKWEMEEILYNFQLVQKLHHPNIANYNALELDPQTNRYFLVMEYVEGEDLRYWLRSKRREGADLQQVIPPVVRQIAQALDYAHSQKIVHRDIKPGNIMIDGVGNVKVLDFGLAAQIHSSLSRVSIQSVNEASTCGTIPYMAPEQWRGGEAEAASDQYALAATVYEMFSGRPPFDSADKDILRNCTLHEAPRPLKDVSPAIRSAVEKALAKEPADRFNSCADFAAAMEGGEIPEVMSAPAEKVSPVELPQNDPDKLATLKKLIASGVFDDAAKICAELLKEKPEDGEVHYLNLLCQEKVTTGEGLLSVRNLPENKNFRLARCFAGPELKQELETLLIQRKAKTKKRKLRIIFSILAVLLVAGGFFGVRYWQAKKAGEALEQMAKKAEEQGLLLSDDKYTVVGVKNKNVGSIEIPDGIRYIGNEAFMGCHRLRRVTIPDSVRGIGHSAFKGCRSLTSVTIPEGVTDIRESTFNGCDSLTSITIPDSVTSIGDYAFVECRSLTSITIPDSVTSIGGEAFYGCNSLTSITIPDSVTSIGGEAFCDCNTLTSIKIPDSVISIGTGAFYGCSSLTSISIPRHFIYEDVEKWFRANYWTMGIKPSDCQIIRR